MRQMFVVPSTSSRLICSSIDLYDDLSVSLCLSNTLSVRLSVSLSLNSCVYELLHVNYFLINKTIFQIPKKARLDGVRAEDEEPVFDPKNPFTQGNCSDEIELKFDDGKSLFVSENFLSLASPVFERMFKSDFKEKNSRCITMTGKDYSVFLEMLLIMHPRIGKKLPDKDINYGAFKKLSGDDNLIIPINLYMLLFL